MLFEPQFSRKPNHYPQFQKYIDAMWTGFWTPRKFNFQSDVQEFQVVLTDEERGVITRSLSAISQVEVAVKTFWAKIGDILPHPMIKDLGYVMANVEVIHNQAYEKLLDVLGLTAVFEENLEKVPVLRNRVQYLTKHLDRMYEDDKKQCVYSLILFTLFVENVSLFSQFYTVSWFNRYRNVLKDTAQQIQYTAKEEVLHAGVGLEIIGVLRTEYPELFDNDLQERVESAARSAMDSECLLIDWIIGDYQGTKLNSEIVKAFAGARMDDSLVTAGFSAVCNPSPDLIMKTTWMDEEVLAGAMTDFFHKHPIEYAKANQTFKSEDMWD